MLDGVIVSLELVSYSGATTPTVMGCAEVLELVERLSTADWVDAADRGVDVDSPREWVDPTLGAMLLLPFASAEELHDIVTLDGEAGGMSGLALEVTIGLITPPFRELLATAVAEDENLVE